ncbi:hypothetical protein F2Q68_00001107 [Brassica cretica]|uniref:Uncharacterized protein n=2 Tax=Brassica cretica TaxID=69181 RepID=A0A8S9J3X9_BRACR|nr:hypothetical protein F2Q68_00001107 [Brassica cretica]KAF3549972.1 hypothetical protein DY000_02001445 [Brassica cretica]
MTSKKVAKEKEEITRLYRLVKTVPWIPKEPEFESAPHQISTPWPPELSLSLSGEMVYHFSLRERRYKGRRVSR